MKLVVETESEAVLCSDLCHSAAAEVSGERASRAVGAKEIDKSFVCIIFDAKLAGEALTAPNVRTPPLRDGRVQRLVSAVLRGRCCPAAGETPEIRPGDLFLMFDGGKRGLILKTLLRHSVA